MEKDFREWKDREREELIFEPIILSIDDTIKFEDKKQQRRGCLHCYSSWLFNNIPEPIKLVGCAKDNIMSLLNTKTNKNYSKSY